MNRLIALAFVFTTLAPVTAVRAGEKHSLVVYTAFFDQGSETLKPEDVKVLDLMAGLIKNDPSYRMRLVAYTDPVYEDKDDEKLAKKRAKAVRHYLEAKGVSKEIVDIKAKGDEDGFGSDAKETDRALRRRVEIRVRQEDREKRSIDKGLDKDADTKVQTAVFFDFDKADIRPEFQTTLDLFGAMLGNNPEYRVRLFGHTDGIGKPAYNQALGNRRCDAVQKALVAAGAATTAIERASVGEGETIGSQTMEATTSRALSRSVELKVFKVHSD